jgi:hypothetical protein
MEGNYPTQREATGMAWVAMLATVNTSLQLFLPAWVRARGPSVYQMVLFGAQGLGAVVWGAATDAFGLRLAFLVAAGLMAAGTASVRVWPLADTSQMDRSTVVRPDPNVAFQTGTRAGPVVVRTTYLIPGTGSQAGPKYSISNYGYFGAGSFFLRSGRVVREAGKPGTSTPGFERLPNASKRS